MDAEKIQKIGKLASELLSHGRAPDIQSAMQQAEQILAKNINVPLSPNQEQGESMQPTANPLQEEPEHVTQIRRLQRELENQKRTITELRSTIASMASKFDNVLSKLNKIEQKQKPVVLEKKEEKPQTQLKTEEKKPNPRSGGWAPGDVAIENIFYSGPPKN